MNIVNPFLSTRKLGRYLLQTLTPYCVTTIPDRIESHDLLRGFIAIYSVNFGIILLYSLCPYFPLFLLLVCAFDGLCGSKATESVWIRHRSIFLQQQEASLFPESYGYFCWLISCILSQIFCEGPHITLPRLTSWYFLKHRHGLSFHLFLLQTSYHKGSWRNFERYAPIGVTNNHFLAEQIPKNQRIFRTNQIRPPWEISNFSAWRRSAIFAVTYWRSARQKFGLNMIVCLTSNWLVTIAELPYRSRYFVAFLLQINMKPS